jgi:hypothetical protein
MVYGKPKAGVKQSEEWRVFDDRVATRQTAQNASGRASRAPKNFTVDDEKDARQALHDRAMDEHNAGTKAAPAELAPADAPSPDATGGRQ